MNVFIDTNIFLNFYHFPKDDLDALDNVFVSHKYGSIKLYLTQQVCDEFRRNREAKIYDALKTFNEAKFNIKLPSFMRNYKEFEDIKKLVSNLQKQIKSISEKAIEDIFLKKLTADSLINKIFEQTTIIETSKEIYQQALMRKTIGNPPGKNNSIGDSINWTVLLQTVPNGTDLHIISEDGDFYSKINKEIEHPFLKEEWQQKKNAKLYLYKTLSLFLKKQYNCPTLFFDKNKHDLINYLYKSTSFETTHIIIGRLKIYEYFSFEDVKKILEAAIENYQFGNIVTDYDISDFLNRIVVPYIENITNDTHKEIIDKVIKEQKQRLLHASWDAF